MATSIKRAANTRGVQLYRELLRCRTFEDRVGELFVRGGSAGSMLHLSIGEEAAAVGVGQAMRTGDTFTTIIAAIRSSSPAVPIPTG